MSETVTRNGQPVTGLGETLSAPQSHVVATHSPWTVALVTSIVGAATGWVIEEVAKKARRRRRR